jgi:signal transduction histidine kinase
MDHPIHYGWPGAENAGAAARDPGCRRPLQKQWDLNHTIRDIRSYILDLRPRQLTDEGLIDGLERLASEFRQNTKVEVSLAGPKEDIPDLSQSHAMSLFLICQEALANIAKHAKASRVTIDLWSTADRVLLEVSDDGLGFEVDKTSKTAKRRLKIISIEVKED